MGKNQQRKKERHLASPQTVQKKVVKQGIKNNDKLYFIIPGIITFFVYLNTSGHGFVYDDYSVITGNTLTAKGLQSIPELFATSYWYGMTGSNDAIYRPLSLVAIAIENQVTKNSASLNHVMNIVYYTISVLILLRLLLKMFPGYSKAIPFVIALLWAVHPLHTEVVANIKSRDEILSFLFGMLSINYFVYGTTRLRSLLLGGLCFFAALLSKENALTYLAIIPLTIFFFNYDKKRMLLSAAVILFAGIVYYLIRSSVLTNELTDTNMRIIHNALLAAPDNVSRIATAIKILGLYVLTFLFPFNLSSDYSYNQVQVSHPGSIDFILPALFLAGLLIYAIIKSRKKDGIAYGILFFFASISIVSNIFVLLGSNMADRFMFTPSLGLSISFVLLLSWLFKIKMLSVTNHSISRFYGDNKAFSGLITAIILLFCILTFSRNKDWESNKKLFEADVVTSSNSARMKVNYGKELVISAKDQNVPAVDRNQLMEDAIQLFREATLIDTTWEQPHMELGLIASYRKDPRLALQYYRIAERKSPLDILLLNNMANSYFDLKQYDSAIYYYHRCLSQKQKNPDALANLAATYGMIKAYDSAFYYFNKVQELNPNDVNTLVNLGVINFQRGRYDEAIRNYEHAIALDPGNTRAKEYLENTRNVRAASINKVNTQ